MHPQGPASLSTLYRSLVKWCHELPSDPISNNESRRVFFGKNAFLLLLFGLLNVILELVLKLHIIILIKLATGGMQMARKRDKEGARQRILSTCVRLFIEQGYSKTPPTQIMKEANVTVGSFYNIFSSKSEVLTALCEFMFRNQFSIAREILAHETREIQGLREPQESQELQESQEPQETWGLQEVQSQQRSQGPLLYAIETSIQLALAEMHENLREIYVEVYTQPELLELVQRKTTKELQAIFASYLPDQTESDFYELEIGTSGIMRAYMACQCDMYFPLERKLERFLRMTLHVYAVPEAEIDKIIERVQQLDIRMVAEKVMEQLFSMLEMTFDFKLSR